MANPNHPAFVLMQEDDPDNPGQFLLRLAPAGNANPNLVGNVFIIQGDSNHPGQVYAMSAPPNSRGWVSECVSLKGDFEQFVNWSSDVVDNNPPATGALMVLERAVEILASHNRFLTRHTSARFPRVLRENMHRLQEIVDEPMTDFGPDNNGLIWRGPADVPAEFQFLLPSINFGN